MSTNVTFNGTTYAVPASSEQGWGSAVSSLLLDLGNNSVTTSGTQNLSNKTCTTLSATVNNTSLASTAFVHSAIANDRTDTGRNRLDNVTFEAQQRPAGPWTTIGGYTVDRWIAGSSGGAISASVSADTSFGGRYKLTNTGNVATSGYLEFRQRVESIRIYDLVGQNVMVSFYCAASSAIGVCTYQILLQYPSVTDDFTTVTTSVTRTFVLSGSSAQRFQLDMGTLDANHTKGLQIVIRQVQTGPLSSNVLSFGGMQLEAGTICTPLERKSHQLETLNCQRYYQNGRDIYWGYGNAGGTVAKAIRLSYMRTTPAVTYSWNVQQNASGGVIAAVDTQQLQVISTVATTNTFGLDVTWTANAEL